MDSRIVRDLIVLARDKAITAAYVLSGDEDIREGVAEAQDCGVSVVLLGITPQSGGHNQARSLVQEADGLVMLTREQMSRWITLRESYAGTQTPRMSIPPTDMEQIGNQFGEDWVKSNPDGIDQVVRGKPNIPPRVDRELLAHGSGETRTPLTDAQRRSLRAGFWTALSVEAP